MRKRFSTEGEMTIPPLHPRTLFRQGIRYMKKISFSTREQKYQFALFGILVFSSLVSIGLFAERAEPSPLGPYNSLRLNLFLAWIPLGLAWVIYKFAHWPIRILRVLLGFCALLWLLFFPNSLYILTDFQHIAIRNTDSPIWYDVIMLLWFSWSGLFLGVVSLYLMQDVVTRQFGKAFGWVFVAITAVLGSLGVYIGRFVGINSWDVISSRSRILREHLFNAAFHPQMRTFSFLFALFFLFVYLTFFIFGQLMNEQDSQK